ncbi:MAG: replication factor C large subunit [Candidatus Micrarchaeota archaeon]
MWIFKHAPATVEECAGNDEARAFVKTWALEWGRGKRGKPILLAGPPGTGKTALAHALALQMGWTLVEASPSDVRNKEALHKTFGRNAASGGLYGGMRLLLVESVDTAFDRGGVPELLKIMGESRQPMLFTANDAWEPKISALRANCSLVDFKGVNTRTLAKVLARINGLEGAGRTAVEVDDIASSSKGDLRSAVIDLQYGSEGGRERKNNVFRAVAKLFNAENYWDAVKAAEEADVDFDFFIRWIEENIPVEYEDAGEVAAAFDSLSRADVFKGRIERRRHWELFKYYRALATAGVALSKRKRYFKFSRYAFPAIIRQLSASKAARQARKGTAKKAGAVMHCSGSQALETLAVTRPPQAFGEALGLQDAEADYFKENYAEAKPRMQVARTPKAEPAKNKVGRQSAL